MGAFISFPISLPYESLDMPGLIFLFIFLPSVIISYAAMASHPVGNSEQHDREANKSNICLNDLRDLTWKNCEPSASVDHVVPTESPLTWNKSKKREKKTLAAFQALDPKIQRRHATSFGGSHATHVALSTNIPRLVTPRHHGPSISKQSFVPKILKNKYKIEEKREMN